MIGPYRLADGDDDVDVLLTGLTPDCEHSVTVCAVEPNKHDTPLDLDNCSVSTSFFTLREGIITRTLHFHYVFSFSAGVNS